MIEPVGASRLFARVVSPIKIGRGWPGLAILRVWGGLLCLLSGVAAAVGAERADIHLHLKWSQLEVTSVAEAMVALQDNGIVLAGVIGTPPELAQRLREADPARVFAWYGPYSEARDWSRWYFDEDLPGRARAAIASGAYRGIGELHLIGGFAPRWDTPVIEALLALSAEYRVPMLVHVEFSRADYLIGLCAQEPRARLLLAHGGAPMPPRELRRALDACPNLWWELSARDPWRYVSSPITDEAGTLRPEWRQLILDYSERLMLGSDPVWPVDQLDRWDEPDTGWQHLARFWKAHEAWLAQIPEPAARAIRLANAQRYFDLRSVDPGG